MQYETVTQRNKRVRAKVRQVIIDLLRDYPDISQTMVSSHASPHAIQLGIRYQDVLQELVDEGHVVYVAAIRSDGREVRNLRLTECGLALATGAAYAADHGQDQQPTHA